jgi:protease II
MDKPITLPAPPRAEPRPHSYERHGQTIEDPWHWLRDPNYPQVQDERVLAYLQAEPRPHRPPGGRRHSRGSGRPSPVAP